MHAVVDHNFNSKLTDICSDLRGNILVTGGHFIAGHCLSINPGTVDSFKAAVHTYQHLTKYGIPSALGILIKDIGSIYSSYSYPVSFYQLDYGTLQLPQEYHQILQDSYLNPEDVHIFLEKNMRTRGQKELNRRIGSSSFIQIVDEDTWIYLPDKLGKKEAFLLAEKSPDSSSGIPSCPLIMAGYTIHQEQLGFDSSINYYYIGEDNYKNVPNHYDIDKGARVASSFGSSLMVRNVYFTGNETFISNSGQGI